MLKRRPCAVCRSLFLPDLRLGKRQRTCGKTECQREWQKTRCRAYRVKNAEDEKSFRFQQRVRAKLEAAGGVLLQVPAVVLGGGGGTEARPSLGFEMHLLVRALIRAEAPEIIGIIWSLLPEGKRALMVTEVSVMIQEFRSQVPEMVRALISPQTRLAYGGAQEVHDASGVSPTGP